MKIYCNTLGIAVSHFVDGFPADTIAVFKYTDVIFICSLDSTVLYWVKDIMECSSIELVFTSEDLMGGELQNLNLRFPAFEGFY